MNFPRVTWGYSQDISRKRRSNANWKSEQFVKIPTTALITENLPKIVRILWLLEQFWRLKKSAQNWGEKCKDVFVVACFPLAKLRGLTYRKRTSLVPFVNHSSNYILLNINWKIPCALASYESVSQILKKEEMRVLGTFKCQHEFYTSSIRINNQTGAWGNLRDHVTHSHPLSPNLRFVRALEWIKGAPLHRQ